MQTYPYAIVGAGLAGGKAISGIRALDPDRPILLVGSEPDRPYNRPPLTKELWTGKKQVDGIFVHKPDFYDGHGVDRRANTRVVALNHHAKTLTLSSGETFGYGKLLLATGGLPRWPDIPGADTEGVCYYRYLHDYQWLRPQAKAGQSAIVIGGGFIGSEVAAALTMAGAQVTWIFPEEYFSSRLFPRELGMSLEELYIDKGVQLQPNDSAASFHRHLDKFVVNTKAGKSFSGDMLVVGIGIRPELDLGEQAGLSMDNGFVVNQFLQTSDPDIYAAGDNANFNYSALGMRERVEHWDNARAQGELAGRNMAGAKEPYDYMPYFFSDLFEFGYEAVGQTSTKLQIVADWQEPLRKGVLYYVVNNRVRGAMMCNVWDKVPQARELIKSGQKFTNGELKGVIS
jgi:3-phenylpropionate/trans-cinnamate dioxygenase ferredoxin reductase component